MLKVKEAMVDPKQGEKITSRKTWEVKFWQWTHVGIEINGRESPKTVILSEVGKSVRRTKEIKIFHYLVI